MCGRFYLDTPRERLREQFALKQMPLLAARFNIAPSQGIAAIREGEAGAGHAALGPDPTLGQGGEDEMQHDQRTCRIRGHQACLPHGLPAAAMPRVCQRFFSSGNRPTEAASSMRRG